jgi:hypothetical protein
VNFVSLDHASRAFNVKTDDEHFERNMPKLPWYPNAAVTAFVRDETPGGSVVAAPSGSNGLYLNRTLLQDRFQSEADVADPAQFVADLRADGVTHVYINDFVVGQREHEQAWLARPDFQALYLTEMVCEAGQCVYELK